MEQCVPDWDGYLVTRVIIAPASNDDNVYDEDEDDVDGSDYGISGDDPSGGDDGGSRDACPSGGVVA